MGRTLTLSSIVFICVFVTGCVGRDGAELMVTCLICGEEWLYVPAATLLAGWVSLLSGRGKPVDSCPKCHSGAVVFHRCDAGDARTNLV